jgi:hypothetical protein
MSEHGHQNFVNTELKENLGEKPLGNTVERPYVETGEN